MSKFLLLLFLFTTVDGLSQPGDTLPRGNQDRHGYITDTILQDLEKFKDSLFRSLPYHDSFQVSENNIRNINALVDMQKKRKDREKRAAIFRIGIGIAFLILLVVGLRRKGIKK